MVQLSAVLFAVCAILAMAVAAGSIARRKGRRFWLYFVASLIVGPLALIGASLLPRRRIELSRLDSQP